MLAIIPARYESTRLPGKPLAPIAGKPMIQHVYERAAAAPGIGDVLVATDSEPIRSAVRKFGGAAVLTRSSHVSGTDRVAEAAAGCDAEIIVNVQGDLPFLSADLVRTALEAIESAPEASMSTVKTPIRCAEEWHSPHVVKVVTNDDGFALYFSRSPIPHHRDGGSDAVLGHRHVGVYVYRRDFLLRFAALPPSPLENAEKLEQLRALERGFRIKVGEVSRAPIEVDTPDDLERARGIAAKGVGDDEAQ